MSSFTLHMLNTRLVSLCETPLTFIELPLCPIFSPRSPSCIQLFYSSLTLVTPILLHSQLCLAPYHSRTTPYTYLTCKLRLYLCHAQEVLSISLNGVTHLVREEKERERGKMTGREHGSEEK